MSEPVFLFKEDDPKIAKANRDAHATFKYFWRELYWERRRIIPGLGLAMIKLAFSDPDSEPSPDDTPDVEHMWVDEVGFDGTDVWGILANAPNWLKSVKQGDEVKMPYQMVSDWLYTINGVAYGGFTVNAMRLGMDQHKMKAHDEAWGLDFGHPAHVNVIPTKASGKPKSKLGRLFGKKKEEPPLDPLRIAFHDHPMCLNMMPQIKEYVKSNPSSPTTPDEAGWTMLHHEALAGNMAIVRHLLEQGCDANALTNNGKKASDLAAIIGWPPIAETLKSRESR